MLPITFTTITITPLSRVKNKLKEISMPHMTHNYMLGLAVLLVSFVVLFYAPIAYFWVQAAKQQRKQNKS